MPEIIVYVKFGEALYQLRISWGCAFSRTVKTRMHQRIHISTFPKKTHTKIRANPFKIKAYFHNQNSINLESVKLKSAQMAHMRNGLVKKSVLIKKGLVINFIILAMCACCHSRSDHLKGHGVE